MSSRSKSKGTEFERWTADYLASNGFGGSEATQGADRRGLHGSKDQGDILVCPGLIAECKAGAAAENASDEQIRGWLLETETERVNAGAEFAFLVVKRKGHGKTKMGGQRCYIWADWWPNIPGDNKMMIQLRLDDMVKLLRLEGWGDPIE